MFGRDLRSSQGENSPSYWDRLVQVPRQTAVEHAGRAIQ